MAKERGIVYFFDKLEDKLRGRLSRRPIVYALIGGVGIVLFWKGVWEAAEHFPALYGWPSAALGLLLILPTGLFVSFFIGDNIILSGYRNQKKLADRTADEIAKEVDANQILQAQLDRVEEELLEIKSKIS
jgi:hypothetical protein